MSLGLQTPLSTENSANYCNLNLNVSETIEPTRKTFISHLLKTSESDAITPGSVDFGPVKKVVYAQNVSTFGTSRQGIMS